jgi:tRNA threonylcarbamoyladenosine biosynthesis protein TsaE
VARVIAPATFIECLPGVDELRSGQAFVFRSDSEEATAAFAGALAGVLPDGAVLALSGPLGAGKTAFVRGLARGLGLPPHVPVTSPTYALVQVHPLPHGKPFVHADLYRLGDDPGELEALGFRDWLGEARCVALEWAEVAPEALDAAHVRVRISDDGPTARIITVQAGPAWA